MMDLLEIKKPLVFLDLESSGTNAATDKITEVACVKMYPSGKTEEFETLVNPGLRIDKEVEELTGITNEMLVKAPGFHRVAEGLFPFLTGCDLCGYNIYNFDLPMLYEEFARVGYNLDLSGLNVIDPANIFKKKEPRNLEAASKFYSGVSHADAHRAMPDVVALIRVLDGQMKMYSDLPRSVETLALESQMDRRVDLAGKFVYNEKGIPVFAFGQHKDKPAANYPDFLEWMLKKDFPEQTKNLIRFLLAG